MEKCRFIKVNSQKIPIEKGWPDDTNYSYEQMLEMNVPMYGVLCGRNGLMVVDCDTKDAEDRLINLPMFSDTFRVLSCNKKLSHFYFWVDGNTKPRVFKMPNGKTAADIQGNRRQVVGPYSKTLDGKEYVIANESEIVKIDSVELFAMLKANLYDIAKLSEDKLKKEKKNSEETDPIIRQIKAKLTLPQLAEDLGYVVKGKHTSCPVKHSTESGTCLSMDDETFKCFNCDISGSIMNFYMLDQGVEFNEAKIALAKKCGIPIEEPKKKEINPEEIKGFCQDMMKKKPEDVYEMIATWFAKNEIIFNTRSDTKSETWIYKDGIYLPNGKSYVRECARELMEKHYENDRVKKIIDKLEMLNIEDQDVFFDEESPDYVPVQNGILNIQTNELKEFSPEYKFFNKLPVTYDPDATCPKILAFFDDVLYREEDKLLMQEIFGYLLYRSYKFPKAFMFLGTGRNGKGITVSLMKAMLGTHNTRNITLQKLQNDKNMLPELFHTMANIGSDIGSAKLTETQNFKMLTGQDQITADRKYKNAISFRSYAKMIFCANTLPETCDETDSFFDRWEIIDFKYKFVPQKDYDRLSDNDKALGSKKLRIIDMEDNLTTKEELSGLLNWAIAGFMRLYEKSDFSVSSSTKEIEMKWKRESSSAQKFATDSVIFTGDVNECIYLDDLKNNYFLYCAANNIKQQQNTSDVLKAVELMGGTRKYIYNDKHGRTLQFLRVAWKGHVEVI